MSALSKNQRLALEALARGVRPCHAHAGVAGFRGQKGEGIERSLERLGLVERRADGTRALTAAGHAELARLASAAKAAAVRPLWHDEEPDPAPYGEDELDTYDREDEREDEREVRPER